MTDTENKDEKPTEPIATPASAEAQQAAQETAQEGGTPQQAERAAEREEKQQRPDLTDDEVKRIAGGLVDEMEARGMFEDQVNQDAAVPPTSEPALSPGAGSDTPSDAESTPVADSEPRKRTIAERFAGIR